MLIGWKAGTPDPKVASFRYRVQAPLEALARKGHRAELYTAANHDRYDLVVFSKSCGTTEQDIAARLKQAGKKAVLDLCDNHFYNPFDLPRYNRARQDLKNMIALCDQVICSTPVLAGIVMKEAGTQRPPVIIGDMADLIELPHVIRKKEPATLLWFGSHGSPNAPGGMNDLLLIAEHLRFAADIAPVELLIVSNNADKFHKLSAQLPIPARYAEWTLETFPRILAQADAVLIPLSDNPFVACKTHNRLTTALGAGVPVIADSIPSYREFAPFCFLDDWRGGLAAVLRNGPEARTQAQRARAHIVSNHTMEKLTPLWEAALGLASPPDTRIPSRLYQGALDVGDAATITGWVRMPSRPRTPLQVELRSGEQIVASTLANRDRSDLKAAGFIDHVCGFEFIIPADFQYNRLDVVADGIWKVGCWQTGATPKTNRPISATISNLRTLTSLEPPGLNSHQGADAFEMPTGDNYALQKNLADEMEKLTEAVDLVRAIAARIVVMAGSSNTTLPLTTALKDLPNVSQNDAKHVDIRLLVNSP